jgi:hypothetical protein
MKNKSLIVIIAFLAVIICLIISLLLFFAAKPSLLITLSFTIGLISGVCITLLIYNLVNNFKIRRSEK